MFVTAILRHGYSTLPTPLYIAVILRRRHAIHTHALRPCNDALVFLSLGFECRRFCSEQANVLHTCVGPFARGWGAGR
jgi:hypothetical protein